MDVGTLIGLVGAVLFVALGIVWGGQVDNLLGFWDFSSVLIVFGGTICATLVSFPLRDMRGLFSVMAQAFKKKRHDLNDDIDFIIDIAIIARKEGLLSLEDHAEKLENPFVRKGIMLMADGCDPEMIRTIMRTELELIQERHMRARSILEAMASYAPAFGMIGTLIGLINMLKSLDQPDTLGPGMALALITTFYGIMLANVVFTPLSKKLKSYSDQECLQKELLLEGMLSIQDGENPRIIRDKLNAFIARSELKKPTEKDLAEEPPESRSDYDPGI